MVSTSEGSKVFLVLDCPREGTRSIGCWTRYGNNGGDDKGERGGGGGYIAPAKRTPPMAERKTVKKPSLSAVRLRHLCPQAPQR